MHGCPASMGVECERGCLPSQEFPGDEPETHPKLQSICGQNRESGMGQKPEVRTGLQRLSLACKFESKRLALTGFQEVFLKSMGLRWDGPPYVPQSYLCGIYVAR